VGDGTKDDQAAVQSQLKRWIGYNDKLRPNLDLFTYEETKSFLNAFRKDQVLRSAIDSPGAEERFRDLVNQWSTRFITLRYGLGPGSARTEFDADREVSFRQWS